MIVVLLGMKHCGKSTIGTALAGRWGCPFHDVDVMIEATHACAREQQLSAAEIFAQHGAEYFRRLEGEVVCELDLKMQRAEGNHVVALGGRTALNPSIIKLLSDIGLLVHLRVSHRELLRRVKRTGLPRFLEKDNPDDHFLNLCRERDPQYQRLANLSIDLNDLSVEEAVQQVASRIKAYGTETQ